MLPTDPPAPTGLIDEPVPVPVVVAREPRRRGWVFAVAMLLVAIMGGGALFMSGYGVGLDQARARGGPADEEGAWKPFWAAYEAVRDRYPLEHLDRTKLVEGAIRGLIESVGDPYSSYLSPQDFQGTLQDISGQFEGIGAEIGTVDAHGNTVDCNEFGADCRMVIIAPIEGSPAEKAGLKPGDIIATIDGSNLNGLTPDQARDRIRGKAGTDVKLHIVRLEQPAVPSAAPATPSPSAAAPTTAPSRPASSPTPGPTPKVLEEFDVTLTRAKIQRSEVTSRTLADGSVGYVRLAGFSDAGADQFVAAVKKHVDAGVKRLVIDLRGNPGGFLTAARTVASTFIASGPVYWQENAQGGQVETDAKGDGVATDASIKVVCLVDKGTASASEIVAGALQDRERATLIGQTTFGKGTVQEWLPLVDASNNDLGGVKLTVWKWLTPNKHWIHKVGITPDVAVDVPANTPPGQDPVLDKALQVLGATAHAVIGPNDA